MLPAMSNPLGPWFADPDNTDAGVALEGRQLEQVTDIGVAFTRAISRILGDRETGIPAVYRSVQILSDLVASLHLDHLRGDQVSGETYPLLEQPAPHEPYITTIRRIMASLLLRGNAYVWATTRNTNGFVAAVYVIDPDEMVVTWDEKRLYPRFWWRDREMTLGHDLFHVAMNHWPGSLTGMGPIEAARSVYEGIAAEQVSAANLWIDDATPSGALKVKQKITKAEAEAVLELWEETHGSNRKRPAVLGAETEWQSIRMTNVDAQFIESRNYSVLEISRLFGLPSFFLSAEMNTGLTYTTTESMFRHLVTLTLNPTYLEPIAAMFSQMLPLRESARFNTDELLRADIEARYRAARYGIDGGFITPNEARKAEGLKPLPGGDELAAREERRRVGDVAANV